MSASECDFGVIGLGVMGANFGWNVAEHGFHVIGYDRDPQQLGSFVDGARAQLRDPEAVDAVNEIDAFVAALRRPRAILLLVPAGKIVDDVIAALAPHIEREDVIIDGGNSHFVDTDRRLRELARRCVHFLGMGVSGGAAGARRGPSLMPGGSKAAWERAAPLLEAVAAKIGSEPCVAWLGRNAAGHYVKMIHNGIEYGLMELIAESYDLMRRGLALDHRAMHAEFQTWAESEFGSYLLEITADILLQPDSLGSGYLIDKILDIACQKGTGIWSAQEAMDRQVPTPVIDAAVSMRALSADKERRRRAMHLLDGRLPRNDVDGHDFLAHLGHALQGAMLMTYAQGFHLLRQGSQHHGFGTRIEDVARIWRGGCIIRARLLEELRDAFSRNPGLANPILDAKLAETLNRCELGLRQVVQVGSRWGVPVPAFMAALAYFDAYGSAALPTNLIQAQRDYFGAHTFERTDRTGTFHVDWRQPEAIR